MRANARILLLSSARLGCPPRLMILMTLTLSRRMGYMGHGYGMGHEVRVQLYSCCPPLLVFGMVA